MADTVHPLRLCNSVTTRVPVRSVVCYILQTQEYSAPYAVASSPQTVDIGDLLLST